LETSKSEEAASAVATKKAKIAKMEEAERRMADLSGLGMKAKGKHKILVSTS
jgi:hypothetical protein